MINYPRYTKQLFTYITSHQQQHPEIRDTVIRQYASSLHDLWVRSFGSEYVKPYKTIPRILYRIMAEYDKYHKTHLYGNAKRGIPSKPIRRVNRD